MKTPDTAHHFIADVMLGRLARWLRILGYDVAYDRKIEDARLIQRARREDRLILTRDRSLLGRRWSPPVPFVLIEDDHLPRQLRQITRELNLSITDHLLTRCVECNEPLRSILPSDIREHVPMYVLRTQDQFAQCPGCGRVFWRGTHWDHILQRLRLFFPEVVIHPDS